MRVVFVNRPDGPERLVCEAEVLFEEGQLAGMKLVGFTVWKGADGDLYVTFPSRAFGAGSDRRLWRGPPYGKLGGLSPARGRRGARASPHNVTPAPTHTLVRRWRFIRLAR